MEINTIILRAGHTESLAVSHLIFQLVENTSVFVTKKMAWDSFMRFLVTKFKSDIEWRKEDYGKCSHNTAQNGKFCSECGMNFSKIKYINETLIFNWVIALFSSDCDSFGADNYDLEDVDEWSFHVNFDNITGKIEIGSNAAEILTFEISQWAEKNDPEFFATLNPNDTWDLDGLLGKEFYKEMDS